MPPLQSIELTDGINIVMTGNFQFLESKLNVQGRLAGIAGNLAKKEKKLNEWLQMQPPFAYTYLRSDYEPDHPVWTDPGNLPVWRWVTADGLSVVEVTMWIWIHIVNDAPLTLTSKCQNKELGPITGEWWL